MDYTKLQEEPLCPLLKVPSLIRLVLIVAHMSYSLPLNDPYNSPLYNPRYNSPLRSLDYSTYDREGIHPASSLISTWVG